jgi:hypothetical protein
MLKSVIMKLNLLKNTIIGCIIIDGKNAILGGI